MSSKELQNYSQEKPHVWDQEKNYSEGNSNNKEEDKKVSNMSDNEETVRNKSIDKDVKDKEKISSQSYEEVINNQNTNHEKKLECSDRTLNTTNKGNAKTNNKSKSQEKNIYCQFDIRQLAYDLEKEYSHIKLNRNENFLRRMVFDSFKRQTKSDRIQKLVEKNKVKLAEEERIKGFNRLIEDANRRIEAQEQLEHMKDKLFHQPNLENRRRHTTSDWGEIYSQRFVQFITNKENKLDSKIKEKRENERIKEEEIVEANQSIKKPRHLVEQAAKRLYEEAERRKLKYGTDIKQEKNKKRNTTKDNSNNNKVKVSNF